MVVAQARYTQAQRETTYREQALKMYPHICARCGREFGGKRLRELTVHHKDQNHDSNPMDGTNWELLCLYCHENEHDRQALAAATTVTLPGGKREPVSTHQPFAALQALLKPKP
jgi:5-methylcytosine-specific restriction endonuclease McrA